MDNKFTLILDNVTVFHDQGLTDIQEIVKNTSEKSKIPPHTLALRNTNGDIFTVVFPQAMNSTQVAKYLRKTYGSVLNFAPKSEWRDAPIIFKVNHLLMGMHHVMYTPINTKNGNVVIVDDNLQAIDTKSAVSAGGKKVNAEIKPEITIAPALLTFMGINPNDRGSK